MLGKIVVSPMEANPLVVDRSALNTEEESKVVPVDLFI